ncbi:MAG: hypothetical protein KUL86_09495 [Castellaniella sp.]|nr:hypothetical protein [Castellaniella sp.]
MMMTNATNNEISQLHNGPGAAALLAAGIGSAAMGIFSLLGDAFKSIGNFFNIYNPAGTLSGVSTGAIVVWVVAWAILSRRWAEADVNLRNVSIASFVLLVIGFAFTFPPIMDFIQGK